jgi:outer membrane protein assembly factor BamB
MFKKYIVLLLIAIVLLGYLWVQFNNKEELNQVLSKEPNWSVSIPSRILYCHPHKESYVLVQTTNEVMLLSAKDGERLWVNHLSDYHVIDDRSATQTGMQVEKGILVTHRGDGAIQAIEVETGKILWEDASKVGETIDSIYINNETVFVAIANNSVIAFDIYTGNTKWSFSAPSRSQLYLFGYKEKIFLSAGREIYDVSAGMLSAPLELDGLVNEIKSDSEKLYISYVDSNISYSSLSLISFQSLWKIDKNTVPPLTSIIASILIDDNIVYYVGEDIVAIGKEDGELLWLSNYNDEFGRPVIIGNFLFAQGRQKLYILDKNTGAEIQSISLKGGFRPLEWIMYEKVNPCANSNTVWIARGKMLYAYNVSLSLTTTRAR